MFDHLDRPIWGVPAIAEIVNRPPSKVYYLLGKIWCSTPRELLAAVTGRGPAEA
jgi:hypothetical protein